MPCFENLASSKSLLLFNVFTTTYHTKKRAEYQHQGSSVVLQGERDSKKSQGKFHRLNVLVLFQVA